MDSTALLTTIAIAVAMAVLNIALFQYRNTQFKRFTRKHPEVVWVWYSGPAKGNVHSYTMIEGQGMGFTLNAKKRGLVVLPGPIRVDISYYNHQKGKKTSFTQTVQFTAVPERRHFLLIDEENRIMQVLIQ